MNITNIKKVLEIVEKHVDTNKEYLCAEHDIIYFPLFEEQVPEDSEAGKLLLELGAHIEIDSWAAFV